MVTLHGKQVVVFKNPSNRYLYIRFTASRHNQLDESIASALNLLSLLARRFAALAVKNTEARLRISRSFVVSLDKIYGISA